MATVKQISVHYSGKKGLPNYGSVGCDVGFTLDLDEGEDEERVALAWMGVCKSLVVDEIKGALAVANGNGHQAAGHGYTADKPTRTSRNSDPEPYTEKEVVIDPLTQRPVVKEERSGNTSDQAIARGHLKPDPSKPSTWPTAGEPLIDVAPTVKAPDNAAAFR
jgi:hypothetical protein